MAGERGRPPAGHARRRSSIARAARGGTIGYRDYSHPIFEIFKAPRSGDFSAARIQTTGRSRRARTIACSPATTTARWRRRSGASAPAASSRWTTSLDDRWNDLPKKPVYLPLVHQLVKYLGAVRERRGLADGRRRRRPVGPAQEPGRPGRRHPVERPAHDAGVSEPAARAERAGHLRDSRRATTRRRGPERIAVNLDPAESDLAPLDPQELVATRHRPAPTRPPWPRRRRRS